MEASNDKTCPINNDKNPPDETIKVCPDCDTAHQDTCCEEHQDCTADSCDEQLSEPEETVSPDLCTVCGAAFGSGDSFCPACGAPKGGVQKRFCEKCGTQLEPGQAFCPKCGQKANLGTAAGTTPPANKKKLGKKATLLIVSGIALIVLIAVLAIALLGGSKGPDFKNLYEEYCSSVWAEVASDGSYLSIDTNPKNKDDSGLAYPAAFTAVKDVNRALGLPASLVNDMAQTTGADGKQSESFPDCGVTVSWRYHPDKGLEVTYKKIN